MVFKNKGLPAQTTFPDAMIVMTSPRTSASSMKCVVNKIVLPGLYFFKTFQVNRRAEGSMPLEGSSRRTTYFKRVTTHKLEISSTKRANQISNKAVYTAASVACGWAGAVW